MTVTVSAPDGSTVDFPDGTDAAVIHDAMTAHFGNATAPAPTLGATVLDVGKQAVVGPVRGVAALAGLPGDASAALNNLLDWVGTNLGEDPQKLTEARKQIDAVSPASSQDVIRTIEKVTGALPQAQTTPGKYVGTIGSFVPAALAGPEGAVANVGKLAAIPGAASEYLGEKTQGTWLEPIARFMGALAGHGAGIAASKGGEVLANRAAASQAATNLGGDVNPGAVNRVAQSYAADKLTPADVAAKSADLGPEAMMLDMGRQMAGRAEAVATQPGAAQNTVLDAVEARTGQFGAGTAQRVKDTLDQTMGPSPDIVAAKNNINAVVDQHARPLYQAVMDAHPVVDVPASITNRPAVAQAMKDAVSLAKNRGEQLTSPTQTNTILQGPGYHIAEDVTPAAQTSLGYWDYVKKAMDARINGMLKTGGIQDLGSQEKADLGGLQDARSALVSHLDNVTGGAYAVARKAAAEKFQVNDAIDLGRSALNTGLLPEELADQMTGMSLPEQAGVKLGMRREVDRIIDTARNDGAAARRLLDTNQNSQKIAAVFGQPAADAIGQRIAAETQFQDMTNKISANSRTAVRSQLVKDTESPSVAAPPMANIGGLALSGLRKGAQFLSDQGMDRTRQGIADLVTRQGPQMSDLARVLAEYNTKRAANAMPPLSSQAKPLAAIIAAQQAPRLTQNPPQ